MAQFTETVRWATRADWVEGAVVMLRSDRPNATQPPALVTGRNGTVVTDLDPGLWTITVLAEGADPATHVPQTIEIKAGDPGPYEHTTTMRSRARAIDNDAGKKLLRWLIAAILAWVVVWVSAHQMFPEPPGVDANGQPVQSYVWTTKPMLWLDMYLLALIGILCRLTVSVGTYVRYQNYFLSGTWQHVSLLVVIPIVSTLFVYFLTALGIQIGTDGATLSTDDPEVRLGLCFIAAAVPWALWDRLLEQGQRFFGPKDQQ